MTTKHDSEATVAVNIEELRNSKDAVSHKFLSIPRLFYSFFFCAFPVELCLFSMARRSRRRATLRVAYQQSFRVQENKLHGFI
jgi:hypothetical protein